MSRLPLLGRLRMGILGPTLNSLKVCDLAFLRLFVLCICS